jgi:hypothetical protein
LDLLEDSWMEDFLDLDVDYPVQGKFEGMGQEAN